MVGDSSGGSGGTPAPAGRAGVSASKSLVSVHGLLTKHVHRVKNGISSPLQATVAGAGGGGSKHHEAHMNFFLLFFFVERANQKS